jgi:steroid delta-isomerase-like uncharacterized protein
MDIASNGNRRQAVERWAAGWSAHDVDAMLRGFTSDAVYEDVPMGVVNRGIDNLHVFAEQVLARVPDISFELRSTFADSERGVAEWIMRGTRELPGRVAVPFEVRGVSIFEFAGDKIRRCSDYWDMGAYRKQLGM